VTEVACAQCGCRVDAGVRLAVCDHPDCCCQHLPTVEEKTTDAVSNEETQAEKIDADNPQPDRGSPPGISRALDRTFKIGLILKAADGVLEIAGGLALLVVSPADIQHFVRALTAHELSRDPHDFLANHLLRSTVHLSRGTTLFGAVYLLSHGVAKVVLVVLVLRDRLWAYPWLIALLMAFIVYQVYRITAVHFSLGLLALTIFDAALVWLTWREYQAKRRVKQKTVSDPSVP
jgi:uncharacterized membrane protein